MGRSMTGQSTGQFSEAFVTYVRVPVGKTYCALSFQGCGEKSVPQFFYKVLTSWIVWRKEWGVKFVKSIF